MKTIEETMSIIHLENNHRKINTLEEIEILTPTVNCPSQETEVTSTPTRPVDNVVITTKGLQDRNINILDGRTVQKR